jgi:hypothetical protein
MSDRWPDGLTLHNGREVYAPCRDDMVIDDLFKHLINHLHGIGDIIDIIIQYACFIFRKKMRLYIPDMSGQIMPRGFRATENVYLSVMLNQITPLPFYGFGVLAPGFTYDALMKWDGRCHTHIETAFDFEYIHHIYPFFHCYIQIYQNNADSVDDTSPKARFSIRSTSCDECRSWYNNMGIDDIILVLLQHYCVGKIVLLCGLKQELLKEAVRFMIAPLNFLKSDEIIDKTHYGRLIGNHANKEVRRHNITCSRCFMNHIGYGRVRNLMSYTCPCWRDGPSPTKEVYNGIFCELITSPFFTDDYFDKIRMQMQGDDMTASF